MEKLAGFFVDNANALGFIRRAIEHQRQPRSIALALHLIGGNKTQALAIDAVAQAATVTRAVGKDMAQVRIGAAAAHFGAAHVVAEIQPLGQSRWLNGAGEAGPAAAAVEFVTAGKQGLAADDIHVQARLEQVVVGVAEGPLRAVLLGDAPLLGGEGAAQGGIVGARPRGGCGGGSGGGGRWVGFCALGAFEAD